jgi:hypothetical protein
MKGYDKNLDGPRQRREEKIGKVPLVIPYQKKGDKP